MLVKALEKKFSISPEKEEKEERVEIAPSCSLKLSGLKSKTNRRELM